jgi:hypothetical protein
MEMRADERFRSSGDFREALEIINDIIAFDLNNNSNYKNNNVDDVDGKSNSISIDLAKEFLFIFIVFIISFFIILFFYYNMNQ